MEVEREDLLRTLEAVAPGLARKETLEQSSCFIFKDGWVHTFNDEIACSMRVDMPVEGAVAAKPLLELLGKLQDDKVVLSSTPGELLVKGGRSRRSGITLEADVVLPFDAVTMPTSWETLSPEFEDAVAVVVQAASKQDNLYPLTCVHVRPDMVEACDNYQIAQYPISGLGIKEACLIKATNIKALLGLKVNQVAESESWLHFRVNGAGSLTISMRREVGDYRDLTPIVQFDGQPAKLPGGLAQALERAEIFSGENADDNQVQVHFRKKEIRLRGEGASGWYEERATSNWAKDPFRFNISPTLLAQIAERSHDCTVAPGRLRIECGKLVYVTCLGAVDG